MSTKSKKAGDLVSMLSEILKDCPEDPYLRMRANQVIYLQEKLHKKESDLLELIEEFQAKCTHEKMLEVRKFDFDYRARVGGVRGLNVLLGHQCAICKIFKPRKAGPPSEVCYKCGGDMKFGHYKGYCVGNVHIHKCTVCSHEYEDLWP